MQSNIFNIGFRSFIALFFLLSVLSMLVASVYMNQVYQRAYKEISQLKRQALEQQVITEKIHDSSLTQLSRFKDLLILGNDPDKYYEYLAKYYETERHTQQLLLKLQREYKNHEYLSIRITALSEDLARTASALRKALRVFNSTDIDPVFAASEYIEGQDDELSVHIKQLEKIIVDETDRNILSLQNSISVRQNQALAVVGIILTLLLIFFYRRIDNKITRPVSRIVKLSSRFGNPEDISLKVSDMTSMFDQLERNITLINLILNSTGEAIYTVNTEGICTYANPACAKALGFSKPAQLTGNNMHELIQYPNENGSLSHKEDSAIFKAASEGTQSHTDNVFFCHKDGHCFPVDYRSYPVFDNQAVIGSVVTFTDITERRKAQQTLEIYQQHLEEQVEERTRELEDSRDEAIRANLAKDTFLSQMSHEFRTPMNAILGFAKILEMYQKEPLSETQLDNVRQIYTAGEHLLALINRMLDLTQMSSGKFHLEQEVMDICPLIKKSIQMIDPLIQQKSIRIVYSPPEGKEPSAYTDERALSQVLINLISNAVKFSPDKSLVSITCKTHGNMLRIYVTDEGPGIASEDQKRIFNPFERAAAGRFIEGSGIGLSVCRNIMELMGGDIGVDSTAGKGSSFWIDIPLRSPTDT